MKMNAYNFEYLHPKKYADVIKMARKFVATLETRPILKMVHHDEKGRVIATNSHVALIVEDAHGYGKEVIIDPNTLEVVQANYPDLTSSIPDREKDAPKAKITLNKEQIAVWLQMHKSMNQMAKSFKGLQPFLEFMFDDGLKFHLKHTDISFNLPYEDYVKSEDIPQVGYSILNLRNSLETFKVLESDSVTFEFYSRMGPFLATNGSGVNVVLSPIRTY
ncbi:DNA polymerase [Bacillus phage BCASJ1c]|uniref:19 n=1 Tax=Bacillus phage BCASJ1c TaxID=294382 RepID=Q5YA91_9CAUD|nr:DNA polymerase [Bacillus phage BCASJ1c]AAU85066.1 19 [Bacillus phage BCASJ1c]